MNETDSPSMRSHPALWDDLTIPADVKNSPHLFTWLEEHTPTAAGHDYILCTDGSGGVSGFGSYAAGWARVDRMDDASRGVVRRGHVFGATYGSTVQRMELTALLEGLYAILRDRLVVLDDEIRDDPDLAEQVDGNPLLYLRGGSRITVMWYTDRSNLAQALLRDDDGQTLAARTSERDLWLRFSFYARMFCITPSCRPRNVIPGQKDCDSLCTACRVSMQQIKDAAIKLDTIQLEPWNEQPQKALF